MVTRRNFVGMAAAAAALLIAAPALARKKKPSPIARFDTNKDGTVDLAEAKAAAGKLFDRLDTGKNGKVTIKELQGRLSRADFAAAGHDKNKTLTRDEYLALVEKRFKAADADHDGTLSAAEFETAAGRSLRQLLG